MALAIDHIFRAGIITLGTLVVIPSAGYVPLNKTIVPTNETNSNKELNEKIRVLGIDESCFLENLQTSRVCQLNKDQMKKINFPEKEDDNSELSIEGLDDNKTVTLTIESGYLKDEFPETLRFTFKNTNNPEVTIGKTDSNPKILKPNVGYDYKISPSDNSQLLKAWTLQILGGKVGLNIDNSQDSVCILGEHNSKINVWKFETEYVIGAKSQGDSSCLMDAAKDIEGYLEGFKLTVKGENDITLTEGEGPTNGTKIEKITKDGVSYEIGPKNINGTKKWFLIERAS